MYFKIKSICSLEDVIEKKIKKVSHRLGENIHKPIFDNGVVYVKKIFLISYK